ncbi:srg family chemoreceptor domain-containing protein [Ditylenchus destructor]|nr:srg family chemoreceptor domain-containing protein [Ditylenchus destructor]
MAIQPIILAVFDLPAFVFHLSMLIFILSKIVTKNPFYRQGFYVLFCAVTIVDLFYIAINYGLSRIAMFGFFVDFYLEWTLGAKLIYELTGYCAWFQACAHTLIAFNRFTVFYFNRSHAKIWSGRCMVLLLIGLFISPLFGLTVGIGAPVGILKKNPFYRQGFYELFCAVTIVDLFYIAIVSLRKCFLVEDVQSFVY